LKSILFADPNRDLLNSCGELLRQRGYDVTAVFDGTQVVEKLEEKPFDLALVGETLPRIPTARLLPLIHEKGIPVLLLGDGSAGDANLAFPFLPRELYAAVGRFIPFEIPEERGA